MGKSRGRARVSKKVATWQNIDFAGLGTTTFPISVQYFVHGCPALKGDDKIVISFNIKSETI